MSVSQLQNIYANCLVSALNIELLVVCSRHVILERAEVCYSPSVGGKASAQHLASRQSAVKAGE